jgi:hypothetical protein
MTKTPSRAAGSLAAKWLVAFALAALASCGGGGGSPAASGTPAVNTPSSTATGDSSQGMVIAADNVLTMVVDRGTDGSAFNTPFVNVTVCQPGTDNCKTIDHVLVDSASYGLRLAASAVPASLSLPTVTNAAGAALGECAHFASGYAWGSVRRADVRLAAERATNIPVQVVADPATAFAGIPPDCSSSGANFGVGQGANGILGVGMLNQDCGAACVTSTAPAVYFGCGASGCTSTTVPLSSQVANPVPSFAVNNNGVAMVLPAVPNGGAAALTGALIFGIGTQSNNQLGSATIYAVNRQGNFTTTYKGVSYPSSFIDSGSNAIFFSDPDIPLCSGFYCPPQPLALTAVNTSPTSVSATVDFRIESIRTLAPGAAAGHVGADIGLARSFDWGLPFFFGRTVFVAGSGALTPAGPGPYWAY